MRPSPAPTLELADVIRRHAPGLAHLTARQRRVLNDLAACRTAALGGHLEICDHCGHQRPAYNSCRNRHCPKCQSCACARWMANQARDLLPVEYFHVVFTLPDAFNGLALANPRLVYGLLFQAVSQTLLEVAAHPKRLGARIGFLAILHTWGQDLCLHPHIHCVVPGGGLSPDGTRWIACRPGFFLPVRVLSRVFRGKFIHMLRRALEQGKLPTGPDPAAFEALIQASVRTDWVVYAKKPFGGPAQVLKYLSRYTHRIAISNHRLVSMDDRTVSFRCKDYAHGGQPRIMTLEGPEFLRRFLMHIVPPGFMRIRHFGLLANRCRGRDLQCCRHLLAVRAVDVLQAQTPGLSADPIDDGHRCPICRQGRMVRQPLKPQRCLLLLRAFNDSS